MYQTPREIVKASLTFATPQRMPRDLWVLPWADEYHPSVVKSLKDLYPPDFVTVESVYRPSPRIKGEKYDVGYSTDEWGCVFKNIQKGVHGEIENPIVSDIKNWQSVQPPYEILPEDKIKAAEKVNHFCEKTDKFVFADCCPRPWERLQFLRGTENAMMDVMVPDEGGADLIKLVHDFYMKELEFWVKTDVDAIMFMDDWGTQTQLLIPPRIWRELFKPLYKEYCDIAHANGKFAFMHSDGNIQEIYTDLVQVGVDAVNSQLFCMDMEYLEQNVKGQITFWGEIDRQHVLNSKNPQDARDAVKKVAKHLYDPKGGVIAQFEFGPGAEPENTFAIFDEWDHITS